MGHKPLTTAELIFYASKAGLLVSSFDDMTVGQIEDVIIVYCNYLTRQLELAGTCNENNGSDGVTIRDATQSDFDKFATF